MGRPADIMIWLVLVIGWTFLFAVHIVSANANFLPGWFTGTAFDFPLNLVTQQVHDLASQIHDFLTVSKS